ncbi:GAF domain-containing protein [Actinophytocola algeriensis]|uniref:Transcriptional regulator with GAF, ATPase, and Fis domain n=1 Tax=Actinophytocola algeriensis TaxID=1768010 RepID=A0A7W7VK69_9PSEU|nr:GAF domain-containing protein [Actinophytocola algeriensis]MBB4912765.1 transcriptional regulator with GAF, ATPase, and Fis domain [Actinophytocola algeriensis]MBE1473567.1 transcriptional regulator with GAF, ATPase, and Fis domain [Actinophytocola algeriensis]
MPPTQDVVSDTIAAITARLAARHDGMAVLRAVTDACGTLLSADATGVLIADPRGGVEVIAASDEPTRFVERLQAELREGPCLACIDDNTEVAVPDPDTERERWPRFADAMTEAGFRSMYAHPLRLMNRAVGGLNIFYTTRTDLPPTARRLAQALADLAVLGLTQERDQRRVERLAEQTLTTLNDRTHLGHAVGVVASTLGVTPDVARAMFVAASTQGGRSIRDLANAITSGALAPADLHDTSRTGRG